MRRTIFRLTQLETRDTPVAGFSAFGAAAGGLPLVAVLRPDGTALAQFSAFEDSFRGGVRAAVGELDGDPNTQEVVVGAGTGGGPAVKLYSVDVNSGAVLPRAAFFAFEESFRGGVRVAVGSVAGQGESIIVGAGEGGGPRVRVLDASGNARTGSPLANFFAYEDSFRGGVQVSAGELDGNPATGDELVVAAGTGGGPRVRVIRSDGAVLADYFAFDSNFRGGANVAVETTGGSVDRIRADALALDPSQRNTALNNAAFTAANPTAGTGLNTGANGFNSGVSGFNGGTNGFNTGTNGLGGVTNGNAFTTTGQFGNLGGVNTGLGTNGFNTGVNGFNSGTNGFNTGVTGQTGITSGLGGVGGIGTTGTGVTSGVFGQTGGITSGVTGQTGIASGVGGVGGIGTTTGTGGIGATTGVGGVGNTTGVGGIGSVTNAGGISNATGVNNLGTGGVGFGGSSLGATGATGIGTGAVGTTGATTLTTGTAGLTGPLSVTAFGPFGNPGQVIATPTLFNPAFAPGLTRYTILT